MPNARKLKQRYNELEASDNFFEYQNLPFGKPHKLVGNLKNHYSITLDKKLRLIIEPITESLDPESLKKCKKIDIKGVVEYHGNKNEWVIP